MRSPWVAQESWLHRVNREFKRHNRKLVRAAEHNPYWRPRGGRYVYAMDAANLRALRAQVGRGK
jgi:hypothetical protein